MNGAQRVTTRSSASPSLSLLAPEGGRVGDVEAERVRVRDRLRRGERQYARRRLWRL